MKRFDAVLFDLDGTVLYTLPGIAQAINRALSRFGRPVHTLEQISAFIGNGTRVLTARALAGGREDPLYEAVFAAYCEEYALHGWDGTRPYDGIEALLAALSDRGLLLAVVTNKDHKHAVPMIQRYFPGRFSLTLGRRDGVPAKPDPAALLAALKALGVTPDRALYVGDSPVDSETAQNAGTACVLADWGYRAREVLLPCPALGVVSRPAELLEYL